MKKRILQCLSLILCAAMLAIPAAAAASSGRAIRIVYSIFISPL